MSFIVISCPDLRCLIVFSFVYVLFKLEIGNINWGRAWMKLP